LNSNAPTRTRADADHRGRVDVAIDDQDSGYGEGGRPTVEIGRGIAADDSSRSTEAGPPAIGSNSVTSGVGRHADCLLRTETTK
jgi:hypothetical protein